MIALDAPVFVDRRRAPSAAASGFVPKASVVHARQDVEALAARWQMLENRSSGATPFQSLGWVRAIYDFEVARGNESFDPVLAVFEDGRRLIAVLPLERIRTAGRRVLVPLGNGFGQYADMLLDPAADPAMAMAQMLAAAIAIAPADVVSLLKVRDGSALARGLPKGRIETGTELGAPYIALDAFPDFAAYFTTIRAKTRKNMRNARNRLEREGLVAHEVVVEPGARRALIERTLAGRAERLREQGLTSRAFRDGSFPDFCESLAARPDIELMAFSLTHNGKPIAEQWGFVQGGRYYAYVAARDFSNSDESPGKLHLGEVLKACAEHRLAGCDLGVPAMPYKLTFATGTVPVRDFAVPVTLRGWLAIRLWDVLLRPRIKAVLLRMPTGMRARIMHLAGRG
jgi:CelD/BcsL family acetyltransferase involved in cellulose biosynthesis